MKCHCVEEERKQALTYILVMIYQLGHLLSTSSPNSTY